MKTNRSLIKLILLSIITLGIYALFFWHGYVRDVNTICEDDGKHSNGILLLFLFSLLTLGIYFFVWMCGMQNRLCDYSARKGAGLVKSGGNIVCWWLFGSLLVGIGPLVTQYIQIDTLNRMAYHYNSIK